MNLFFYYLTAAVYTIAIGSVIVAGGWAVLRALTYDMGAWWQRGKPPRQQWGEGRQA